MAETIDHSTLSELAAAGAIKGTQIIGQGGGWTVTVRYGNAIRQLSAQRSRQVRLFRKFETLVAYLRELGIAQFDVDSTRFDATPTVRRPDRTIAMRKANEAVSHDKWFRSQVQASLDDTRPSVPDDEARKQFATRKAALRATR